MDLTLVVAAAENDVIGRDGDLPWRLPADLAHFKQVTMGHPIVMGRRTWESIGRPLPGRENIVVSRNADYAAEGARVVGSLGAAVDHARGLGASELMVIGGAGLYAAALPVADRVLLTRVHAEVSGDTKMPPINADDWEVVGVRERAADERNPYALSFMELRRRGGRSSPG
jgi:dihydrofolate reductase